MPRRARRLGNALTEKARAMSADYNGMSNGHTGRTLRARRGSPDRLQKYTFCIAVAASLVTVLSTLQFISFQALSLQAGNLLRTVAVVGAMAFLAGLFAYVAIRFVDFLAGYDRLKVLTGAEPLSIRWFYLFAIGIIIGGGVALFSALAVFLLLPLSP